MQTEYQRQQEMHARCYHPSGQWIEFKPEALEQSVVARFTAMVDRYPERLALQMGDEQVTYQALNAAANRLAHAILAQRGVGAEPLALLFEQGVQAIVAMLAVWKAGKFFMTLNPGDPPARLAQVLQDGCAAAIITTSQQRAALAGTWVVALPIIAVDEIAPAFAATNPVLTTGADDLACIIYTSGSTGKPKGVVYTQRNVLYRVQQYTNLVHLCAADRLALVEYYSFNGSLRDIFSAILNGAALFLFNLKTHSVEHFTQLLHQEAITLWVPVVSAFRAVRAALHANNLPHLRLLGMTGETLHRQDLEAYQHCTPPTCLLSLGLGSSETVGAILCGWFDHQSELPTQAVPLGYPVAETEVQLLDETGKAVPMGKIGEIVVRSGCLAHSYWQEPELTATTFLPNLQNGTQRIHFTGDVAVQRPDGQFVHLGRKDQQIKIRGHRVELVEIEQALVALACFSAVAVVARLGHTGEQRLIAYVVPANEAIPTTIELQHDLQQILPDYMIPPHFVFLDTLPLTVTGKVDRSALPVTDDTKPTRTTVYQSPRTPLETQVAAIWGAVLGLDAVGIHDNFLEVGGNSLTALQIIAQVLSRFRVSVPIQQLFTTSTIADMALLITQHQAAQADDCAIQQLLDEIEALSEEESTQQSSDVKPHNDTMALTIA